MPKPAKKGKKKGKKGGKGSAKAKKDKGSGGKKKGKKKGKKGKKKGKKKGEKEPEIVVVPLLDPYAIRTQCLRPRSCLDIGHGRSRGGRLANVVLDSLLPPLRFWSFLREIRIWGHGARDAKRLAVALYEAKSRSKIDTLCLRANEFGCWNQTKVSAEIVDGAEEVTDAAAADGGTADGDIPEAQEIVLPDEMTDPLAVILMLPALTSLDLSNNKWTPSEEFSAVLTSKSNLLVLQVNNNSMGSTGLTRLLNSFPVDARIEEFGISKNEIGPSGGKKLAQALNVHATPAPQNDRNAENTLQQQQPEDHGGACRFKHLQILNASGNLFGPARYELGEALTFRPNVSVVMGSSTMNKENYKNVLRKRAAKQLRIRAATCYICRFFRRSVKKLKNVRLAMEAENMAAEAAAAAAEAERLKAEKAAAKAAKKAGKKKGKNKKKGKKGKKEKKGAGASKKKGGKKEKKKGSKKEQKKGKKGGKKKKK
jgi:hypothetical protein